MSAPKMLTLRQAGKECGCSHEYVRCLIKQQAIRFLDGKDKWRRRAYLIPESELPTISARRRQSEIARTRRLAEANDIRSPSSKARAASGEEAPTPPLPPARKGEELRCNPGVDCMVRCGWRFHGALLFVGGVSSSLAANERGE